MKVLQALVLGLSLVHCSISALEIAPPNDTGTPGLTGSTNEMPGGADTTPPTLSIVAPMNGSTFMVSDVVLVNGMAADDVGVASVTATAGASTLTVTGAESWSFMIDTLSLPPGALHVVVSANDAAGNRVETSLDLTLTPRMAPVPVLSGLPAMITSNDTLSVTVGGTRVSQYKVSLDGAGFGAAVPVASPIVAAGLGEGPHTLDVIGGDALDFFQAESAAVHYAWTVDKTAPLAVLTGTPAPITSETTLNVGVEGMDVVAYRYDLDMQGFSVGPTLIATPITASGLADGPHVLLVLGIDAAGNEQAVATRFDWTVDTQPPTATLANTPPALTGATAISVDVSGADVVSYQYRFGTQPFADATSGWSGDQPAATPITQTGLASGDYVLEVVGRDTAGNLQAYTSPTSHQWSVDASIPNATLSGLPAAVSAATGIDVTVGGAGIVSYRASFDAGAYSASTLVGTHIIRSGLSDGAHSLSVVGTNAAAVEQPLASATSYTWTVNTPPLISQDPASQTIVAGASVTFTVTAAKANGGAGTLSYQWKRGSTNVGTNAATLTIPATSPSDAGSYTVVVTHTVNNAVSAPTTTQTTSAAATLTINSPPAITTHPVSQTIVEGQPVSFTVAATGSGSLSYQWKRGSADVGTDSATLTIASVAAADAGSYTCVVTNTLNATTTSTTSNAATLTVNSPAAIGTQPLSQTIVQGQPVTFSVAATGSGTLSYQWRKDGLDIGGATAASYTIAAVSGSDAGSYTVVVSNTLNATTASTTSTAAVLTVNVPPTIDTQPVAQTIVQGQPVTFTVAASGNGTLSYQWRKGGVAIGGATAASYSIASVSGSDAASYDVVVTNTRGATATSSTSAAVALTVNAPPTIDTQPVAQTIELGQAVSFSVAATGSGTLSYQWQKGGADISGQTGSSFSIAAVTAADAANYRVIVTNTLNATTASTTSSNAALTVAPDTTLAGTPANPSNAAAVDITVSSTLGTSYVYSLDCAPPFTDVSNQSVAAIATHVVASGLPDGDCTLSVAARTAGGVLDPTPATYTWTVDVLAPVIACASHMLPLNVDQPIVVSFDQAIHPDPPVVTMTQANTPVVAADRKSLSITGAFVPEANASLRISAKNAFGLQSTQRCAIDLVPADTLRVYVTPGPSAACSGSIGDPCHTLADAAAVSAASFKVVYVAGGTYTGALALPANTSFYGGFSSDFSARDVALHVSALASATTSEGTIPAPEATLGCVSINGATVVDGFEISGPTGDNGANDARASVHMDTACDAVIRANHLLPPAGTGVEWWAGVRIGAAAGTITENYFSDDASEQRVAVRGLDTGAAKITRNVIAFTGNATDRAGIALYLNGSTAGALVSENSVGLLGSASNYGIYVQDAAAATGLEVANNSVVLSEGTGFYSNGTASLHDNSVSVGGANAIGVQGSYDATANTVTVTGTGTCYGFYEAKHALDGNTINVTCGAGGRALSSGLDMSELKNNTVASSGRGFILGAFPPGLVVENNTVSASAGSAADLAGVLGGPLSVRLNTFASTGGSALLVTMDTVAAACASTVVERNRLTQRSTTSGFALQIDAEGCVEVRNNLIGSALTGVHLDDATGPNVSVLENNTIVAQLGIDVAAGTQIIRNNLINGYASGTTGVLGVASTVAIHNDVFGFTTDFSGFAAGTGNVSVDPGIDFDGADNLLATWGDNQFQPASSVSCDIRAGALLQASAPQDFLDAPRTQNAAACVPANGGDGTSIGAYEID